MKNVGMKSMLPYICYLKTTQTKNYQHIDAGCGQMMKLKIAVATDSWLEKEDNLDKND